MPDDMQSLAALAAPTDSVFDAIYDFNEQIVKVEDRPLNPLTSDQRKWMSRALREEIKEFDDAETLLDHRDMVVEQVDALIDAVYYAVGGLKKMGLTRNDAFACFWAVHRANMTKRRGSVAKRGDFGEDAVKPEEWVDPKTRIKKILYGE